MIAMPIATAASTTMAMMAMVLVVLNVFVEIVIALGVVIFEELRRVEDADTMVLEEWRRTVVVLLQVAVDVKSDVCYPSYLILGTAVRRLTVVEKGVLLCEVEGSKVLLRLGQALSHCLLMELRIGEGVTEEQCSYIANKDELSRKFDN